MDTARVHPETLAGDPFAYAGEADHRPHACLGDGYVYIGRMTLGEDGEEEEVFEAYPCRRCMEAGLEPRLA
jgi:hypothetical protein